MTTSWDPDLYTAAWNFAARAHAAQQYPGTELPYILHVGNVAMEVLAALQRETDIVDPDLAVQCALLHDVLEDTEVTYETLSHEFGPAVAAGVRALSKDSLVPSEARMTDSLTRIRQQPREVWMVKLADRISNLQAPPAHWSADRCARYQVEAGEILAALGEASVVLAVRLRHKIDSYLERAD